MKPFIVMTTGRTGSTSLMNALMQYDDIALPHKQIDCIDNEILHPDFVQLYLPFYQQFFAKPIQSDIDLINAFFLANQHSHYAGFKSMPNRHKNFQLLINSNAIQFITLTRHDKASTIASFMVAIDHQSWRRNGEAQKHKMTYSDELQPRILGHLNYILQSEKALLSIPNAIHLNYEDLCQFDFKNSRLNEFFNRDIQLIHPKTPVKAKHYVNNWDEFEAFVDYSIARLR